MSHTGDYSRQVAKPQKTEPPGPPPAPAAHAGTPGTATATAPSAIVAEAAPRPLDWHGTRRAQRYRVRPGVEIQVDGNPASVVDLSVVGVQVLSATVLRPNQKGRPRLTTEGV